MQLYVEQAVELQQEEAKEVLVFLVSDLDRTGDTAKPLGYALRVSNK